MGTPSNSEIQSLKEETQKFYQVNKWNVGLQAWLPQMIENQTNTKDQNKAETLYDDKIRRDTKGQYQLIELTVTSKVLKNTQS